MSDKTSERERAYRQDYHLLACNGIDNQLMCHCFTAQLESDWFPPYAWDIAQAADKAATARAVSIARGNCYCAQLGSEDAECLCCEIAARIEKGEG